MWGGKVFIHLLKTTRQITRYRAYEVKRSKFTSEAENTHIHEIKQLSSVSKKLGQLGRLRCSYNPMLVRAGKT